MKILFITSPFEDYLQDQLLIGLRSISGSNIIDYPKKDALYINSKKKKEDLYGCGFTIWKSLPDIDIDRTNVFNRIQNNEFDLIIFSSIWRQKPVFKQIVLNNIFRNRIKFVFIDGEDHPKIYKKALPFGKYFKREQTSSIMSYLVRKINFSIPLNKIRKEKTEKTKLFAKHNQCEEAYKIEEIKTHCVKSYAFSNEENYFADIAKSKFAITMKKAGWECMRHYEIAANFTVPCFYKLNQKPKNCAPHGLIDMINVISFDTSEELLAKINYVEEKGLYNNIQQNAFEWASNNSCEEIAKNLIFSL